MERLMMAILMVMGNTTTAFWICVVLNALIGFNLVLIYKFLR